jgi:zinc protease
MELHRRPAPVKSETDAGRLPECNRMSRNRINALFVLASIAPVCTFVATLRADDAAPQPKKITTVEGITEYRLDNGLQVLLFPDPSKPTVTVNVTYLVGSRHEGYGETGMAHLLEHLVFKGTPDHPEIWKLLQEHGAQFNGSTWVDRTNYFETMAASDENLEFGLKLEADRMVNSFIAKKDLDSEMSVVRNEFEMGENNPTSVLSERVMSTAYLWHNYGKSTIGSREDIERVPIDRLQAFYRKFYQPDNAVLAVAGKFDEARTLARIQEIFGRIPRPDRKLDQTYTVEPPQDGEREVMLRRVGDVQAVDVVYHICAGSHEDMAPLDILASVLTADQTGRLYKALVEPQLATRVFADAALLHDPGYLDIMAEVRKDKSLVEVRDILLGVVEGLSETEFTDEEVDRAKNEFARRFDLFMNDSGRVAIRLSESAAAGDWRLMFLHRDQIKKVTPADLKRVAAAYLKPSNRTLGMFIPAQEIDRTIVPPTPDVAALLDGYRGSAAIAQGEDFEATPANIDARTTRSRTSTGMKLALLSKKTRGERVIVNMAFHYGSEADLTGKTEAADFVPDMLTMGTTKHSRRDIQDSFDKLKANVRISGGAGGRGFGRFTRGAAGPGGTIGVSIETIRPNLPAVLELVAECLRESTFPEDEFEKSRKESLAGLERTLTEPMALAPIELRRRLTPVSPDDIRYVKTIQERIDAVKALRLDDVKAIYKNLVGASHAEAAVVGDFDKNEIASLFESLFVNWKSPRPFQRIDTPYRQVSPDSITIKTPDKANALFTLGTNLSIRDDDADYPALFMANYIAGGSAGSRLLERIRQKEGLSYGVGSNLQASPHEASASFSVGGIAAPQNAEKAVACAREELERFGKDGVTQKELDDARKGFLEDLKVGLSNDAFVSGMITRDLHLDRTMKFLQDRVAKIEALTPEQVTAAARKYLSPDKLIVVTAGDFDKKVDAAVTKPGGE